MKPLQPDQESLCRIARAFTKPEQDAVAMVAKEFFPLGDDGFLHNKRADEEIEVWKRQANSNRRTGRLGGRPRTEPDTDSETGSVSGSVSDSESGSITGSGTDQEPSPEARSQKPEANTRAIANNHGAGAPPDPRIDKQVWQEFEQHRRDIRKPLTELARQKNAAVLVLLTPQQQRDAVNTTIANRWTGIFPPKDKPQVRPGKLARAIEASQQHEQRRGHEPALPDRS